MPHLAARFSVASISPFTLHKTGKLPGILSCASGALLLFVAGCATNPANLPQLPGTGLAAGFNFVMPNGTVLDTAVVSRQSTYVFPTTITDATALRCSSGQGQATPNGRDCVVIVTPTTPAVSATLSVTALNVTSNQSVTGTYNLKINPVLAITPPSPDPAANPAVIGRSYGMTQAPTWTASGGLPPYHFAVVPSNPAGLTCRPVTPPPNTTQFSCSAAAIAGTPGIVPIQVTVTDTNDQNTSTASASSPTSLNLTLVPEVQAAWNQAPDSVPAVSGRSYGEVGSGQKSASPPTFAVTNNGGLGGYTYTASAQPGGGIVCTGGSVSLVCQTNASTGHVVSAVGGPLPFSAQVLDAANAYTPSKSFVLPTIVQVNAPASVALVPGSPDPATNHAVVARSYGQGTGCSGGNCAAVTYAPAGGTGNFATLTATGSQNGITCTTGQTTSACTSGVVTGVVGPGVNISVQDVANAFTPSGSAAISPSFTANLEMTAAWNTDPATVPAVMNRSYGKVGSGQTSLSPPTFTVTNSGGLGGYSYSTTSSSGSFACPTSSVSLICQSNAVTGAATITPQVSDTANATTPTRTIIATASPITVKAEMTADFNFAPEANPAVNGRSYGEAGTSGVPATFAVSNGGGLSGYSYNVSAQPGGGVSCTTGASPVACSTISTGHTITGSGPLTPFQPTVTDTANAYTPSNTIGRPSGLPTQITANSTVSVALAAGSPDPASSPAVQTLAYGFGTGCQPTNACKPVQYTASGGAGTFASFTVSGNPSSIPCTSNPAKTLVTCSTSGGTVTDPAASYPFVVTAQDQPNAFTPAGAPAQLPGPPPALTLNAAIGLSPADATSATPPDGGDQRAYGIGACTGGPCVPLTHSPSGGNTPYVANCSALPVGMSCALSTNLVANASQVNVGVPAGTTQVFNPSFCILGTANQTTPAGSACSPASTLTVHAPLAGQVVLPALLGGGTKAQMPNLLNQSDYTNTHSFAFQADGNLAPVTCALTSGSLPAGFNALSNCSTGGTPNTPGSNSFQITVTDPGNVSVPSGAPAINNTPIVIDTLAYAASPATDTVEVIKTTNGSPSAVTSIALPVGSQPTGVAATPEGAHMYVTLLGTNKVAVIDTSTNAQITGSPFALPGGCTGPKGIAITPDGARFYLTCSTSNEVLAIRTSDNATVDGTFVLGAATISDGVAVRSDGKRVYVTQRAGVGPFNQIFIIDNTAAPTAVGTFVLTANRPAPVAIVIAPHGANVFYAYIAKQNPGVGNIGAVDVFDVTSDSPTSVASLDTGANTQPVAVAFDPSDSTAAQIYVTLNGSNQFAVIDNTASPPTIGLAQDLPDPTLPATDTPVGIAFPPHVSGTAQAFIAISSANQVDVIDNLATPAIAAGSPVTVTKAGAQLAGIAVIPLPK